MTTIRAGDRILLWAPDGPRRLVTAAEGTERVAGLGVLKLGDFIGKPWGASVRLGDTTYRLLRPILADHAELVDRGAQIILPKDASRIVFECGLRAGARVAEAGVGSGALTVALANAVQPSGRVYAHDIRDDHLAQGKKNVKAAGLDGVVDFRVADVTKGLKETELDACVFDLPEPEKCVDAAWTALASGGVFAAYSPLVSQVEKAVQALRAKGFFAIRALELIERPWVVGDRGSRPETTMLAHTGFLVFARRP